MDWSPHFPAFINNSIPEDQSNKLPKPLTSPVTIADIGCGFGGLLVALSPIFPSELIIGMEIRTQVTQYVQDRISALRAQNLPKPTDNDTPIPHPSTTPNYNNISVLRANTMKFLPNFFSRNQLTTIFLCFPDPHFKTRKHKARIVSTTLCAEYAYVLRPGGCIYTITDVEELAGWMRERFVEFGGGGKMFKEVEVPEEGREGDWIDDDDEGNGGGKEVTSDKEEEEWAQERKKVAKMVKCIREDTEEGKKVTRNRGKKFVSVWRRLEDPKWPDEQ